MLVRTYNPNNDKIVMELPNGERIEILFYKSPLNRVSIKIPKDVKVLKKEKKDVKGR